MDLVEFHKFLESEIAKIKMDKWIEGEKLHKDPGLEFEIRWVELNGKNYSDSWECSKCRYCIHSCRYKTLSACEKFEKL